MTTPHAPLIPSFRDFNLNSKADGLQKPTVLEVQRTLEQSPAGIAGKAVNIDSRWNWLERMSFLDAAIPGIVVHNLGGNVPFQADGLWGPYEWYYRERGGAAFLRLAPIATFPSAQESLYSSSAEVEEFRGGKGWLTQFLELWEELERNMSFYEFPCKEIQINRTESEEDGAVRFEFSDTGAKGATAYGWGYTPEEAHADTMRYRPYLEEMAGWNEAVQKGWREAMEISKIPITLQERVYPEVDPDFSVSWDKLEVPEELQHFL